MAEDSIKKIDGRSQVWRLRLIIPAIWEAEVGGPRVQGQTGRRPWLRIKVQKAWDYSIA